MSQIRVVVRCEREPKKHAKILLVGKALPWASQPAVEGYARVIAEVMDGSSEMYHNKPGEQSPIGRCAVCGGKLTSEVMEAGL